MYIISCTSYLLSFSFSNYNVCTRFLNDQLLSSMNNWFKIDTNQIWYELQQVSLGVETFWLSPIYRSPMAGLIFLSFSLAHPSWVAILPVCIWEILKMLADFGYDISSYVDIDPIFGTLQDFDLLSAAAKVLYIRSWPCQDERFSNTSLNQLVCW